MDAAPGTVERRYSGMRRAIYEDDVIKLLDKGWKSGIYPVASNIHALPSAEPQITHCRDCKHRPKATKADEKVFSGFSVKFPDEKCPCQCGDGWYSWYPEDDFYCGFAERAEE